MSIRKSHYLSRTVGSLLAAAMLTAASVFPAWAVEGGTVVSEPSPYKFSGYISTLRDHFWSSYDGSEGSYCGATLISPKYALTAGHCLQDGSGDRFSPNEVRATFGRANRNAPGGEQRGIKKIFRHPDLNIDNGGGKEEVVRNDIAILELSSPVSNVQPVVLPACIASDLYSVGVADVFSVGWGSDVTSFKNEMRLARLRVNNSPNPDHPFSSVDYWHTKSADETSSSGRVGSGDSGNGLVTQWGDQIALLGVLHGSSDTAANEAVWQRVDYASLYDDFPDVTRAWAPPLAACH